MIRRNIIWNRLCKEAKNPHINLSSKDPAPLSLSDFITKQHPKPWYKNAKGLCSIHTK